MVAETRFSKSGDVHVAYQVTGNGPVDLVWAPGALSHVEMAWENPYQVRFIERLSSFARLIRFDKRGTGMSDPVAGAATLEQRVDDIRAVLDDVGSEAAHLFGVSEGGSMTMLFAAMFPKRTRSLALWGAMPRWTIGPDWPWGETREEQDDWIRRVEERGAPPFELNDFTKRWLGPAHEDPAFVDAWRRARSAGGSPAMRIALARLNEDIDVRDILPSIRVPTLVMNRTGDPDAACEAAKWTAARITGARFLEFPGYGHLFFDILDEVADAIERFITGAQSAAPSDRVLATLLIVDIVGSTEQLGRLGDAGWRNVLDRYYAIVRRQLAAHRGVEVDTAGDGLLARFDGPARAIRCAREIQAEARALDLSLRAGVHTGEVELAGQSVRGIAVHTAARIAALAGPGDVYASTTVRDLVAGSGIAFADRGLHTLKGITEPRQVLAVA
jgi:pimeloyl-ACP methyl ester carboxylesterase